MRTRSMIFGRLTLPRCDRNDAVGDPLICNNHGPHAVITPGASRRGPTHPDCVEARRTPYGE